MNFTDLFEHDDETPAVNLTVNSDDLGLAMAERAKEEAAKRASFLKDVLRRAEAESKNAQRAIRDIKRDIRRLQSRMENLGVIRDNIRNAFALMLDGSLPLDKRYAAMGYQCGYLSLGEAGKVYGVNTAKDINEALAAVVASLVKPEALVLVPKNI